MSTTIIMFTMTTIASSQPNHQTHVLPEGEHQGYLLTRLQPGQCLTNSWRYMTFNITHTSCKDINLHPAQHRHYMLSVNQQTTALTETTKGRPHEPRRLSLCVGHLPVNQNVFRQLRDCLQGVWKILGAPRHRTKGLGPSSY